jgi:hypothetical protein
MLRSLYFRTVVVVHFSNEPVLDRALRQTRPFDEVVTHTVPAFLSHISDVSFDGINMTSRCGY